MSFSLAVPIALAGLAALLLPVLIHLRRRPQTERIDFAALRWLQARLRPRRQLRLSERRLLLVRLLLISLLAIWLAQPMLQGGDAVENWLVVAPTVSADLRVPPVKEQQQRWLAPGFPALTEPRPPARQPIASLLRDLDATLPAGSGLTVMLPERSEGFDGERLRLSRAVRWLVEPAVARSARGALREAGSAQRVLAVRAPADREVATRYLRAAVEAWNTPLSDDAPAPEPTTLDIAESMEAPSDHRAWLVWLHPGALPDTVLDWVRGGGIALLEARTAFDGVGPDLVRTLSENESSGASSALQGQSEQRSDKVRTHVPHAQRLGAGRVLQLPGALTPQDLPGLLEPDFPTQLLAWFEGPQAAPGLAPTLAQAPGTDLPAWPERPRSLQPWLIWLLLAFFGLERWLASAPRRQADQ